MTYEEEMKQEEIRRQKEQEIIDLQAKLSSHTSEYGDWKMLKAQEYAILNKPVPYNMDDYHHVREEPRARINELQEELKQL